MKLLLIDDDAFLRDMYAKKFTDSGHEVITAEAPANALTILSRDQEFDVILLDMVMPGMTGVELLQAIRRDFPQLRAKCVVLSNQGQDDDIKQAKAAGAVGYIIKAESVPSDVVKKVEAIFSI